MLWRGSLAPNDNHRGEPDRYADNDSPSERAQHGSRSRRSQEPELWVQELAWQAVIGGGQLSVWALALGYTDRRYVPLAALSRCIPSR
jgi:hypothetical protein